MSIPSNEELLHQALVQLAALRAYVEGDASLRAQLERTVEALRALRVRAPLIELLHVSVQLEALAARSDSWVFLVDAGDKALEKVGARLAGEASTSTPEGVPSPVRRDFSRKVQMK